MDKQLQMMKSLTDAHGISGFEYDVKKVMQGYLEPVSDELAKAWDNRFGCGVAIEVLESLKDEDVNINVVSGATVQEEVGLRGAKVAANKVKPDLAIAVDVGISWDTPGMSEKDGTGKMGDGPLVLLLDGSNIGHVGFNEGGTAPSRSVCRSDTCTPMFPY